MQKKLLLLGVSALMVGLALMTSCEGPMGPAGATGTNGTNGTNGIDANSTCVQCHNSKDIIVDHQAQADLSQHVVGGTVVEATRTSCSPCHSSQGFRDVLAHNPPLSAYNASMNITSPIPVGDCYTCHSIHENYDSTDWTFTAGGSFHMLIDSADLVIDRGAINNLCSHCHQPRAVSPMPSLAALNDTLDITSYRFGPHNGPQGAMAAGRGGFMLPGTETYADADNPHADVSCADCHMYSKSGPYVGGHTWAMVDLESGADDIAACKQCHTTSGTTFDFNGKQTEISTLLSQLATDLDPYLDTDNGEYTGELDIYDPTSNPDGKFQAKASSSWTQAQKTLNASLPLLRKSGFTNLKAAAFLNFVMILKDNSMGVHNYPYIHALLQNSIDALTASK